VRYLETTHSARNLGTIFDEYLNFSAQISSLSKSCYFDYFNSLYFSLPNSKINRLQQIQNFLARTVVKSPRFWHITFVIKSLHWLKVKERIEYKLFSLTYKVLTTSQPTYFSKLVTFSLFAVLDPGLSPSHYPTQVGSTLSSPPLSPPITPSLFHFILKTHLFLKPFPP